MDRAWNRKLLVILMLGMSLLAFCRSSSVQQNESYETRALAQYSEGNYRHARDLLLSKTTLFPSERYLLARCYQELEEYDKAVSNYRLISAAKLREEQADPILADNYCYYFSKVLLDSPVVYNDSVAVASNLAFSLPTNSLYYEETYENYLYFEWKRTNVNALSGQHVSQFYRRVGQYLQGDNSQIAYILGRYDNAPAKSFYRRIIEMIDPAQLSSTDALNSAIDIAVDFGRYDLASQFLERHYAVSRDKDYYVRNSARIEYKKGNQTLAINRLTDFCGSGDASGRTYSLLLRYLYAKRDYDAAYQLVLKAMKQFPGYYYNDYIKTAATLDRVTELYNWFVANDSSLVFMERYATEVLLVMIRKNPDYAKKLVARYLDREYLPYYYYISALFDYEDGRTESAYKKFLRIVFENPFTYEWTISLRYENELRAKYREVYDAELKKFLRKFDDLSLKMKCYDSLALREIDPGVYASEIGDAKLTNWMAQYGTALEQYFTIPSVIPELERLTNDEALQWNIEYYRHVEDVIQKRAGTSGGTLARYSYHYRHLYERLKMEGTVVNRLNAYLFDVVGGRLFHLLVPREMQETAYPLIVFDYILTNMNYNTNDTLWVLSSFREESHFRKHVRSWVGAVGFAQVMPYTADLIKRNMGHPEMSNLDFADNTLMGISLFRYLFKRYDGNYAYALGGYNAGEGAINRWRERYRYKTELWVECAEYQETRDYIKRITLSRYYYNTIYGLLDDFGYAKF